MIGSLACDGAAQLAPWWAAAAALAGSLAGTGAVLAAARRWQVLDRPNERSAHRSPTPTLGGIGVLVGLWAGLAALAALGRPPGELAALAASSVALALLVSDDLGRPLRVGQKLAIQSGAAALWLALGPRLEWVTLPGLEPVALGVWSWPLTALWLVGLMNVYNFMDGIDGLTATQTVATGAGLALCLSRVGSPAAPVAGVTAAAAAGFAWYNRPPARIFMGDVGAHLLGLVLGALAILGQRDGLPFWMGSALLLYYLFDATYTLTRRGLRGENLLRAHSQHLYQRLVRQGWTHGRVDLLVLWLDGLLLAGVYATLASHWAGPGLLALAAAILVGGTWRIEQGGAIRG
ncbi:MAG: hypothetical protein ABIL09_22110 [Gemmatimonadota bacterium]